MMLKTKIWKISSSAEEWEASIGEAAALIKKGEVVAFPTETVYGLGADATSDEAVEKIFKAKGRPADNPLIVHISGTEQLEPIVARICPLAEALMERFWPGPLTIVFPARTKALSRRVTAGLDTVAVRMPDHEVALRLIRAAERPVAAPSANLSGRPSATTAEHVLEDFAGRIGGIIDGGPAGIGLESTVVEIIGDKKINILRPGGILLAQLREVAEEVTVDPHLELSVRFQHGEPVFQPRAPGMKYRHYAPKGTLRIVKGKDAEQVRRYIQHAVNEVRQSGEKTGILTFEDHLHAYDADVVIPCGSSGELEQTARELYGALRALDAEGVTQIWSDLLNVPHDPEGIGFALVNRLLKAAGGRVLEI